MADRVGQQLGNYRLQRLLGSGGFADVYLGQHIHIEKQAAIKVLHVFDETESEKFRLEAQILAKLEHPHIVPILDFDIEQHMPFLVMKYLPYGTLRTYHPKGSVLPIEQVVAYIKQIAPALDYIHSHKLVHRDMKPENLLLDAQQNILLSDFGISTPTHNTLANPGDVAGTATYMAPEQCQGKARAASDQYALAIIAYEWLCGIVPFQGELQALVYQHTYSQPPSLCTKNSAISPAIEGVIIQALAKEHTQRFPTVQAFADALAQAATQTSASLRLNPNSISSFPSSAHSTSTITSFVVSEPVRLPAVAHDSTPKLTQECFLCSLDPQHYCAENELRGQIVNFYEKRVDGETLPFITLDISHTQTEMSNNEEDVTESAKKYAALELTRYQRDFVKELIARGVHNIRAKQLTLRVYHLPTAPQREEHTNGIVYHYKANSYTLIILEPDILLNITDLNQASYCARQYLLSMLTPSSQQVATIRGNLVHHAFKELVKDYGRGDLLIGKATNAEKPALERLQDSLEKELEQNSLDLALANISSTAMQEEVQPHLE
ncbi:MAG: protein kinase, partial [Chloroflexota bacterium]|nr:protein kinase [Chloroflexota bacterium]